MRSRISYRISCALLSLAGLALLVPAAARAQGAGHDHGDHAPPPVAAAGDTASTDSTSVAHAADHAMSTPHLHVGDHLRLTPVRPPNAADSARAGALLATLRGAIERYRDVRVAEREGYRMFAPGLKNQRVYHFTHNGRAMREHFRFDPTQPTSLLYRRGESGELELLGAMYVAPKRASPDDLDARVPLSMARWHAHVNICLPRRGARHRWREMEDGRMRFGPAGAITTEAGCDAAGGRFHEQLFGWMVHVNVYSADGEVWGDGH
ncbi:MAG TPA: hypothetical protein VFZ11_08610 [Gemmatimonadaceae bacterium]